MNPYDLLFFLVGLGFQEVLVKPLAMTVFRRSFKLLPKLFDKLDPIMPESIAKLTPAELEQTIYRTIEGTAKEEKVTLSDADKKALFDEFIKQFNPCAAAAHCDAE
jgi:hypothetical protein